MISLFYPDLHPVRWTIALYRKMRTRWIGQGAAVDEFERAFGDKFGYRFCVSVNSGTSALDLAYTLAGIQKGDEVLTPVLTCTATNLPLAHRKAKIVFCDISPTTLTIDLEDIKKKTTKKTKAIVAVNLGGIQVDRRIFSFAKQRGIKVIVDAAQSVGISEGEYGDYICYSFQAIKHFTTGDGGMLVVRTKEDYDRAKRLRWFGIDREAKQKNGWQPYKDREMIMDITEPGWKYHMNDLSATMGLIGLSESDNALYKRRCIVDVYKTSIRHGFKIFGGSYWLFGVLVPKKDEMAKRLYERGVETNPAHLRNDIFSVFGGTRKSLKTMNAVENHYLYLPLHTKMTIKDAREVARIYNEVYEEVHGQSQ